MITAEYFLQKHKKDFVECYFKDYTYTNFMKWSQKDEHQISLPNKTAYTKHMNSTYETKKFRKHGSGLYCYILIEEYITKFKNGNIEYSEFTEFTE